jgi:hypothetical protein
LSERQYHDELSGLIARGRLAARTEGSPADWAMESHGVAQRALLPRQGVVDDAYYRTYIAAIDERLALGGVRLAAMLNRSLPAPPAR